MIVNPVVRRMPHFGRFDTDVRFQMIRSAFEPHGRKDMGLTIEMIHVKPFPRQVTLSNRLDSQPPVSLSNSLYTLYTYQSSKLPLSQVFMILRAAIRLPVHLFARAPLPLRERHLVAVPPR